MCELSRLKNTVETLDHDLLACRVSCLRGVLESIGYTMQGPGFLDGTLEFISGDVIDAYGVTHAAGQEGHALLSMTVFHGVPKGLSWTKTKERDISKRGRLIRQSLRTCRLMT